MYQNCKIVQLFYNSIKAIIICKKKFFAELKITVHNS